MSKVSRAAAGTSTERPPPPVLGSTLSLGIVSLMTPSWGEVVLPAVVLSVPVVVGQVLVPVVDVLVVVVVLPVVDVPVVVVAVVVTAVVPVVVPVAVPVVVVVVVVVPVVPVVAVVVVEGVVLTQKRTLLRDSPSLDPASSKVKVPEEAFTSYWIVESGPLNTKHTP
jgi:hypothetical protein